MKRNSTFWFIKDILQDVLGHPVECVHGWELPSINTGVQQKACLLLTVCITQYILLPTYKKMFITCNCTEVCASQQQ